MVRVTIIIPISRKVIYMNLVDIFVINQNKAFFLYSPFCLKIRDTVVFYEKNLTIMLFNKSKYSIDFFGYLCSFGKFFKDIFIIE